MTHSLHRLGQRECLRNDFVILAWISRSTDGQERYRGPVSGRMIKLLEILARHNPSALDARAGEEQLKYLRPCRIQADRRACNCSSLEEILTHRDITEVRHAVFTCASDVEAVLRDLAGADLGISIVVSGILDEVFEICRKAGLAPHTVNMSLGVWGKPSLLPEGRAAELRTMCGHAAVSASLSEAMLKRVQSRETSPARAALELARQCTCNIFNVERAESILREAMEPETTAPCHTQGAMSRRA